MFRGESQLCGMVRSKAGSQPLPNSVAAAASAMACFFMRAMFCAVCLDKAIAKEVGAAVQSWREAAKSRSLSASEIERMASAFEHEDLKRATTGKA